MEILTKNAHQRNPESLQSSKSHQEKAETDKLLRQWILTVLPPSPLPLLWHKDKTPILSPNKAQGRWVWSDIGQSQIAVIDQGDCQPSFPGPWLIGPSQSGGGLFFRGGGGLFAEVSWCPSACWPPFISPNNSPLKTLTSGQTPKRGCNGEGNLGCLYEYLPCHHSEGMHINLSL